MFADELDHVIGVDPHRDRHALAIVEAATGRAGAVTVVAASQAGYEQALRFAWQHAPGRRAWAIEGTGSYGAGLGRYLARQGERVVEVGRLPRDRRSRQKTDELDALRTARSVLSLDRPAQPRSSGERELLRALLVTRESAVHARTAALCQLRALIVTCPEPLRAELRPLTRTRLLSRCARLRSKAEERGFRVALQSLAKRIQALNAEERQLNREIKTILERLAPSLLALPGVGPISAGEILVAWSHPGRVRSEAAFAQLAGAAPVQASSGQTTRHRLNRGGDRRLNRALHTIIVSRHKNDPKTIAYIQNRISQGKNKKEAIRCLVRYLARDLFRRLEAMPIDT